MYWLSTSLVSMVYSWSIAYWRAQASSADHWHHLSRWCSQVSWYSRALLVLCSSVGRLYVSMLIGSSAFSVLYRVIVYNGYCNGMCACEHIAYRRLAESSWEASGGLLWRPFWGAYWGTSLGSFLGNALGTYKLWETINPWRCLRCSVY